MSHCISIGCAIDLVAKSIYRRILASFCTTNGYTILLDVATCKLHENIKKYNKQGILSFYKCMIYMIEKTEIRTTIKIIISDSLLVSD